MNHEIGKWLMGIGLGILGIGLIVYVFGSKLHWLGKLPGDIRIEKEDFSLYIPITTMILLSIIFSVIIRLIQYFTK
ncbi:DUF2905 domain-containing protein [Echinicola salinicaeni]|uniref:DUF2905 domain-containing protein n=1 Tax=Echinicola salinicaeni TaxID=2762757 RepID=UPI001648A8EA|nr:DUF2905 domain-containing protein [Echinicola salinicaeni]